jgi:TPR repeat protein
MPSTPKKEVSKPKSETASQSKSKATKSAKAAEESEKAKLLLQAAKKGDAIAQYEIARAYAHGYYDVQPDAKQAFEWYLKAATQKHPQSQYEVALCYENGIGVEKNIEKAYIYYYYALYLRAYIPSDKEKAEINYKLGIYLRDGGALDHYGCTSGYGYACGYLEAAAKLGHEQAKQALPTVRVRKFFESIGLRIKRFIDLFKW